MREKFSIFIYKKYKNITSQGNDLVLAGVHIKDSAGVARKMRYGEQWDSIICCSISVSWTTRIQILYFLVVFYAIESKWQLELHTNLITGDVGNWKDINWNLPVL